MVRHSFHCASKWLAPLVLLIVLLLASPPGSMAAADSAVAIPDPGLEAALREAIGKPAGDIYASDLKQIGDLSAANAGIADLAGIDHCINLGHLDLSSNRIEDLSPLSGLYNLTELNLGSNEIGDVSPISDLPMLSWFWLDHNQIADVGPVPGAADILDLSYNQISDLSGLSGSGADTVLLAYNRISDIGPLVDDPTIGIGSFVDLRGNPLNGKSLDAYIPALQARGIAVDWDPPANQYPDRPVNISPANGATGVSLTPVLQGSAYSDADGNDHAASWWQIRSSGGDYENPVWDSGAGAAATRITVPEGTLEHSATYYWRVGYRDGRGLWSSYSKETSFTTKEEALVLPTVLTGAATDVGTCTATVHLSLSSLGSAASVRVWFEWGPGPAYGKRTGAKIMKATGPFSVALSGLSAATTYHYRARAEGAGTSCGRDLTFTTGSAPAGPAPPPAGAGDTDSVPGDPPPGSTGGTDSVPASVPFATASANNADNGTGGSAGRLPVIESLVAENGRPGEDMTVTISGFALSGATTVSFGPGISVRGFKVVSDTEMTARIDIDSGAGTGPRDVTVSTAQGAGTAQGAFTVDEIDSMRRLWVYPAAVALGVVGAGLLAGLWVWQSRRRA